MRILLCIVVVSVMSLLPNQEMSAQTPNRNDSIVTVVRLKSLQGRRNELQREIKIQDAKRNRQMIGVSPKAQEEMNDRQDSICLALRSELTDVILEIMEMSPVAIPNQLINQYNNMVHRQDSISTAPIQPAQPTKPVKKDSNTIKSKLIQKPYHFVES